MEPKDYINNSGGALGADLMWDTIGRQFGVDNHKHWRPSDLELHLDLLPTICTAVHNAAQALKRPTNFRGIELVQRNWFQVDNSEAIYAVSRIILPSERDKGFINRSGKQVVSGGTGWAVEMGIQKNMPIYVFDMDCEQWHQWTYRINMFLECDTPILTQSFAGIGSRQLTEAGIKAIRGVYTKTFNEDANKR